MESRFFLFPGQTLANTKVEDRGQGLHVTAKEWHRIGKHLDRKKDVQDMLDKEEEKRKYLEEGSTDMIKHWENSLENIRKRKEEARLKRIEDIKEDRIRRFFELRGEQAEIRKDYVEKVKKKMFITTGWSRNINSAFLNSEVIFEREKQKEFKKYVKKHEQEVEADYAKVVRQNVIDEENEKAAKEQELYDNRKETGIFLRKIIAENEEKARILEETRLQKESLDLLKCAKEIKLIDRIQQEQRNKERREMNSDEQKYLKSKEETKQQLMQEEKEMDAVVEIYQLAKREIECLKQEKLVEKQDAIIARRELVAKMVTAGVAEAKEEEDRRVDAAIAVREANEDAKAQAKLDHIENIKRERTENYNQTLERKREEKRKEMEIKKWEMVNRYKKDEAQTLYDKNRKMELWQDILKRRKEILDQADDDEKRRKEARDMDECLSRFSYAGDDAKFFDYADEVLELTKKRGRSTYPIEKIILEYKKFNCLLPEGVKCTACEDIKVEDKKSLSRELVKNSFKKKPCKCHMKK